MDRFILTETALFRGITEAEAQSALQALQAGRRTYRKGDAILRPGEPVEAFGLVLSGSVNIESGDVWGNRNILDNAGPGQVFAEAYACLPEARLMVGVTAAEDSEVLFLSLTRLLSAGADACPCRTRLIAGLLSVLSQKNLNLTHKIFHTAPRSIRGRLLSYLSFQAVRQGGYRFEIPFNRQQLADYLCVDRSAMSHELSKMRREGLISYRKNAFCLLTPPADG